MPTDIGNFLKLFKASFPAVFWREEIRAAGLSLYDLPADLTTDANPIPPPDLPPEPQQIPRHALWKCLLLPTVLTLIANLTTAASGSDGYAYHLWFLPLIVGPIAGLFCTPWFDRLLKIRYRGRSKLLMNIGYAFGQAILTPAIGFGACMLTASNL